MPALVEPLGSRRLLTNLSSYELLSQAPGRTNGVPRKEATTVDFFYLAGDRNRDRRVTILDFAILRADFGASVAAPAASLFADDE